MELLSPYSSSAKVRLSIATSSWHGSKKATRLLFLLYLLLLALGARAQATLRKDLRKDFGAMGDGRANDAVAFQKAADFFNQRAKTPAGAGPAVLRIPRGTYLVGEPSPNSLGDLLALHGCHNLTIVGDDSATTIIRYADGLRYGTFDPATHQPHEPPVAFFTTWEWGVRVGTAINLQDCENIEVSGLTLDGNSPHLLVGGHWGDTGIQLAADGLFVGNSRRVRVRRLAVHHFGRDGIQVLNRLAKSVDDPSHEDILLENSRFDYNGRQGLSITGVNGLRAVNCSFSHTGRVIIPALGKPLYSNPGAGIDVEPEGGYATNVRLESCRLVDNAGQALVSDRYGNGPATTKNVVLRDCLLWGVTNWSVWLRQPGFLFENCRLYGAFENGCRAREAGWATRFVGCTFEDRPYHGQPAYGLVLVHSDQEARGMSFERCRFVSTHGSLLYAVPAPPLDSASRFQLRDCTFVLDQPEPPLGTPNLLVGAVLAGTNTIVAGPHVADSVRTEVVLGAAAMPGTAVVQPGSRLQLLVPRSRYQLPGGLRLGPGASLEIGATAALVVPTQAGQVPELYVAPGARLVVHRGGALALQPHTRLTVAGQLIVEDGASFSPDASAQVQAIGKGQVRVSPQAARMPPSTK